MRIIGNTRIFKNEYGYNTSISSKKEDGNYEKLYLSVQLPKDIELENGTDINILDGFISFYKTKTGLPKIKLVVMKFEEEIQEEIQKSDLPF